jgi:hypothetical protein
MILTIWYHVAFLAIAQDATRPKLAARMGMAPTREHTQTAGAIARSARPSKRSVDEHGERRSKWDNDMINTEVLLPKELRTKAMSLSRQRYKNNRSSGVKNNKIGKQSNAFTDLEGIAGEMAFCFLFGVEADETVFVRSASSDAGDARLDGYTFDVKTTKYPNGKLLAVPGKTRSSIDYYVLMTGLFPSYVYRGVMKATDLLTEDRLGTLGYGPTYIAEQQELHHPEWLHDQSQ